MEYAFDENNVLVVMDEFVANVAVFSEEGDTEGEKLFDDVHSFLTTFVAFPSIHAGRAITAWIIHTWCLDNFDTTPRLALLSPEPSSGKTRALEVIELLVPNPKPTFNVSASVLFRSMTLEDDEGKILRPTILLDEADTIFGPRAAKEHEDLRGFINAGYRRGANAERAAIRGKSVIIETFPAFAACAIAGLDDLPPTVMTRSIVIRMRRRTAKETVSPYRRRIYFKQGQALAERINIWVASKQVEISEYPELPAGIEDRSADLWEPLIAIGDAAGTVWSNYLRDAATALVGESQATGETLGIRLLSDLRVVFADHRALSTVDILHKLNALEDSPWGDLRGKPLDARGLSQRLRKYDAKSVNIRIGEEIVKGYKAEDMHDPWSRYLIPQPLPLENSVTNATPATNLTATDLFNTSEKI